VRTVNEIKAQRLVEQVRARAPRHIHLDSAVEQAEPEDDKFAERIASALASCPEDQPVSQEETKAPWLKNAMAAIRGGLAK
jgi:anti-sigma factor RsiW